MADRRLRRRSPALAALAALTGAGVLIAVLLSGCGSGGSGDPLAGYWIGGPKNAQLMVHIVKDGDTYTVSANPDTKVGAATRKGDSLVVDTHAVQMTFVASGSGTLSIELDGTAFPTTRTISLQRVDETQYADAAVVSGVAAIRRGLAMWVGGGGKRYPPPQEVSAGGVLGTMVAPWPTNLFTGKPMQQGTAKGDYTYEQMNGGRDFSLVGYLSDGTETIGK